MYVAVTIKSYRAVKEVGKIKMSVGVAAYYQMVQVCQVNTLLPFYSPLFNYNIMIVIATFLLFSFLVPLQLRQLLIFINCYKGKFWLWVLSS